MGLLVGVGANSCHWQDDATLKAASRALPGGEPAAEGATKRDRPTEDPEEGNSDDEDLGGEDGFGRGDEKRRRVSGPTPTKGKSPLDNAEDEAEEVIAEFWRRVELNLTIPQGRALTLLAGLDKSIEAKISIARKAQATDVKGRLQALKVCC